jgi:glycosyl transferase family 25
MKLYHSYNSNVQGTYIIYIPDNQISVMQAERCLASCQAVGQTAELYAGFDGSSEEITPPANLVGQSWLSWFRVTDHQISKTEIACCLSHISLWIRCIELDQPIVILEHDAVMLQRYERHEIYNAIGYLGCVEQQQGKYKLECPTAPSSSINHNWHFINRAHAYSIDPAVARKMLSNVIDRGIFESLDVMLKSDDYAIYQTGLYAHEKPDGFTTIYDRKK